MKPRFFPSQITHAFLEIQFHDTPSQWLLNLFRRAIPQQKKLTTMKKNVAGNFSRSLLDKFPCVTKMSGRVTRKLQTQTLFEIEKYLTIKTSVSHLLKLNFVLLQISLQLSYQHSHHSTTCWFGVRFKDRFKWIVVIEFSHPPRAPDGLSGTINTNCDL